MNSTHYGVYPDRERSVDTACVDTITGQSTTIFTFILISGRAPFHRTQPDTVNEPLEPPQRRVSPCSLSTPHSRGYLVYGCRESHETPKPSQHPIHNVKIFIDTSIHGLRRETSSYLLPEAAAGLCNGFELIAGSSRQIHNATIGK
jgi:hypothetical protein